MTHRQNFASLSSGTDYEQLANRFRPIFERIAEGAIKRERTRTLPHEPIEWLKKAGFGAVRVPVESGGAGASLPQLVQLLIELAAADSNVPQALRGHFAFVEDRLNAQPGPQRDIWFKRFVAGETFGNAWTEVGDVKIGDVITQVSPKDGRWALNGHKYYSTGSIFADWIDVYARRADNGADVIAAVRTAQPGVTLHDDWDGFGQRTTGSGTSIFTDAVVEAADVFDFSTRFKYQTAFYQLVHLATLAGIARAAERDVAQQVAGRKRIFSTGNAPIARQDPQIQQIVGQISAQAYAAAAVAVRAAEPAQRAYLARFGDDPEAEKAANIDAEIESAQGQLVIADLALRATADLFNALGASSASERLALDRHWRNARTHTLHDPVRWKYFHVGNYHLNGVNPPRHAWN